MAVRLELAFFPLRTTVKPGTSFLLFGPYVNPFSCSAIRSTGDRVRGLDGGLNRRSGLPEASSEPLSDDADDPVSLAERLGPGIPSPARGREEGCSS